MPLSFIKNCNASGGISSPRALVQFGPLLFYPEFPFHSVRVLSVRGDIPFFPYGIAIASANLARPSLLSRTVMQVVVSSPRALVQFGLLLFYPEFPFLSLRGPIFLSTSFPCVLLLLNSGAGLIFPCTNVCCLSIYDAFLLVDVV
jgi:hypothetical protein